MTDSNVTNIVQRTLSEVSETFNVFVLYAAEAGSRAWGFESTDSDYDIRYIYHRPFQHYLSVGLAGRRDVIDANDFPNNTIYDFVGWDLLKALKLFYKSNPSLIEWLLSPHVYLAYSPFVERIKTLLPTYYNPMAMRYHYWHMAKGNYRSYLKDRDLVWLKKYLYVLRPLLAVNWLESGNTDPVPVEFDKLVAATVVEGTPLWTAINELIALKKAGDELSYGSPIPAISNFIDAEMARLTVATASQPSQPASYDPLDELFRYILFEEYMGEDEDDKEVRLWLT